MGRKARRASSQPVSAVPASARGAAVASSPSPHTWTERDKRYWPVVFAVFAVALCLRFFYLGVMTSSSDGWTGVSVFADGPTFMHDEAIYSIFSKNFHEYNFDPVYHGPTLYHLLIVFITLFGDSDFSTRSAAVFTGFLTMFFVIAPGRRWMGARGGLWCALLIAISPVMVTYQRRILFDSWVVLLTLACVLVFQSAITTKPDTWRWRAAWIGLAALVSTFLTTKANSFFVIAMLASFWVLTRVRNLGPRDWLVKLPSSFPLILFLFFAVATIVLAERDGNIDFGGLVLMKGGNVILKERILAGIGFVCCALLWEWLRRPAPEQRPQKRIKVVTAPVLAASGAPAEGGGEPVPAPVTAPAPAAPPSILWPKPDVWAVVLSLLVAAFLYAFFYGHGVYWFREAVDKGPVHVVQKHWPEIKNAMPRMLEYWGGQQKAPRLPGRHDYYLPFLIAYELPIMIAAVCGIFRAGRRRTRFTDLLLWWTFTSFTLYSIANEKVPWLATHVEFPFLLIAGWWLGQVRFAESAKRQVFAVAILLSAAYLLRGVVATNYQRANDNAEPMFYAFTSDAFKDTYFRAIRESLGKEGDIWVYNAWPASWYMRHADKEFPGAAVLYDETFPKTTNPLRLVVCQEPDFEKEKDGKFAGFHKWTYDRATGEVLRDAGGENPYVLLWPRISWEALLPNRWAHWFLTREASRPEAEEPFLKEWSHIPVVVATAP
jgi:predicted membrane-bound mannosyltransferase